MSQTLTHAEWLELHYQASRAEYEEMVSYAGLRTGWHVLDAGCATGTHLSALARAVGPAGRLTGCDVNREHVAAAAARRSDDGSAAYTEVRCASVTELPFADSSFDAVWCANVLQYLDQGQIGSALAEFRRVVRPGGVVAVKDVDMLLWRVHPADPLLAMRLVEASLRVADARAETAGSIHGRLLRRTLEHAGLRSVRQRTLLIERWAPLSPAEHAMYTAWLQTLAALAAKRPVSDDDRAAWRALAAPQREGSPLADADFYACEGQAVAVGTVP